MGLLQRSKLTRYLGDHWITFYCLGQAALGLGIRPGEHDLEALSLVVREQGHRYADHIRQLEELVIVRP